ncbi:MAG: hypothetical protein LUQ71_08250 [Methanoregula sp.]|jgi:hypothetical protein|nr:hypothetical protein [Methanoregula sp.]
MTGDSFELRKFVAPEFVIGSEARLLTGRYVKKCPAGPMHGNKHAAADSKQHRTDL